MSSTIKTVRNPFVYNNENVTTKYRQPFELVEGNYCGGRNASTSKYQTYSPYTSSVDNITKAFRASVGKCDTQPVNQTGVLFQYAEDVTGNKYHLFKSVTNTQTITQKKALLGDLRITNATSEFKPNFGNFTIEQVKDIQVFYDKAVFTTATKIWLGNTSTRDFFSVDYKTFVSVKYHEGLIYLLMDSVAGSFDLFKYDGDQLVKISKTPMVDPVTSAELTIKKNRIEVVYTDFTTLKQLTFAEYDLLEDKWYGFRLGAFPYEILGVHSSYNDWKVYYETPTAMPNNVGGMCITLTPPVTTTTSVVTCPTATPIEFTIPTTQLSAP